MLFDLSYKLNSGERLITIARKHWFLIIPNLLEVAIIISLLIIFANKLGTFERSPEITFFLIISFVIYFIYNWILLRLDYFIITSDRIIKISHKGIWNRRINEVLILDIINIVLNEKGIAATLFKFGSIEIIFRNEEVFKMKNIMNAVKIYQGLIKLKEIKKE